MIEPHIKAFIEAAVSEDIGRGDLFAKIAAPKAASAAIIAKSEGIFAGRLYVDAAATMYDLALKWHIDDGEAFQKGNTLLTISATNTTLLSLERTLLDIVLHASSIATHTAKYVEALKGSNVKLLDTRKTGPLLRIFEKYATRCGGATNHRMGLDDCLMIKDTHLATIDDLETFIKQARKAIPFTSKIEVECETLEIAKEAMQAGADIIMCDNMPPPLIKEVVVYRNAHYPHILLEASGNITLETIKEVAETGVDAISSGSIIHQAGWIDLSMKMDF